MYALKGLHAFKCQTYPKFADKFKKLKFSQSPKTLFITCSDSRILPHHLTNTGPGELFCIRNAGNFIQHQDKLISANSDVATVQYAVEILEVKEIVVCGHARCGAVDAGIKEGLNLQGELAKYLEQFSELKDRYQNGDISDLKGAVIANVVQQMENLMSHDFIQKKIVSQKLALSGWYYEFETGEVEVIAQNDPLKGGAHVD